MLLINQVLLCAATDDVRGLQRLIDRSERPLPQLLQKLWRRFFYSDLGDPWTQALLEAIRSQSHGCIALLAPLSRPSDRAPDGNTPLLEAIARWKAPDLRVLAMLAQREDRFLSTRDGFGDALSHALEAAGGVPVFDTLLPFWLPQREDPVSLIRKKEQSLREASVRAVEFGYESALLLLLQAQASRVNGGHLELYRPIGDDRSLCQQLLLNACTNPEKTYQLVLQTLLPFADPRQVDEQGFTPLMRAVMYENGWAIDVLRRVSDVNALNRQGQTAIEMALAHRNAHEHWGLPQQGLDALALASDRTRTLRVFSSFARNNRAQALDLMPRFFELWTAHEERCALERSLGSSGEPPLDAAPVSAHGPSTPPTASVPLSEEREAPSAASPIGFELDLDDEPPVSATSSLHSATSLTPPSEEFSLSVHRPDLHVSMPISGPTSLNLQRLSVGDSLQHPDGFDRGSGGSSRARRL